MKEKSTEYSKLFVLEEAHNRTIRSISWSPNGRYLASASFDATTKVWEWKNSSNKIHLSNLCFYFFIYFFFILEFF